MFTSETASEGVLERSFTLGDVPGVLWSPARPAPNTPLLLMGHGGGMHSRMPRNLARARQAVLRDGFHVAAIDAPGHGDRPRSQQDQEWVAEMGRRRRTGESLDPVLAELNGSLAERAVPEWQATIDSLLMELGGQTPIGYVGMTVGAVIGVRLAEAEPRVRAAILGGFFIYDALLDAARTITIPLEMYLPWDDTELDRQFGLTLFDAFASEEKTLIAFPGTHRQIPAARIDTGFFRRQLQPNPVPGGRTR